MTVEQTEEIICATGMKNLLGKSKKLIMNYPQKMMESDEIKVITLSNSPKLEENIHMALDLNKGFNDCQSVPASDRGDFYRCRERRDRLEFEAVFLKSGVYIRQNRTKQI